VCGEARLSAPLEKEVGVMAQPLVVIGASGFVGYHLLSALPSDFDVRVFIHNRGLPSDLHSANITTFSGDLLDRESLRNLLTDECVVMNLTYLRDAGREHNLAAIRNLADACAACRVRRLVHCSTAMVYGDLPQNVIDEGTECAPESAYETVKWDIERLLVTEYSDSFELAILRPTAVFGPYGKNLLKLSDQLHSGSRTLGYVKACLLYRRRMNLVAVDNVVAALLFLADPSRTLRERIYIASDDDVESNTYGFVERYLMERFGIERYTLPVLPAPRGVARAILRASGSPRTNPLQIYRARNLTAEGYRNVISFEAALDGFADWYRTRHSQ